ncbi:hypothetical protein IE81DRAFT_288308 [Ceraceosorus guamensis]|uniref:Ras modification protein ERF4 n=1 Tax=Ceraceosorus guamensis TaxID=1522189 RepID=A0A316W6M6_9BASI|nr:hypothetical protein IE81DRAFT_288308 [Ceraceosorus guamensis]PWN43723.1 hypothetical protein IE81DRAFT_288308 [Ceraceosorus guamensis]
MGPRSSYYTGPPGPGSAFGTAPAGVIGRDRPREVIRVERDYTLGELCQFHPTFPLELEGRIAPVQFGETINDLNEILIRAHNSGWAAFDNVLAVLTLWISPLVVGSKYNREMKELRSLLDRVNKQLFNPAGLNVRDPAEAAFLFLEVRAVPRRGYSQCPAIAHLYAFA